MMVMKREMLIKVNTKVFLTGSSINKCIVDGERRKRFVKVVSDGKLFRGNNKIFCFV